MTNTVPPIVARTFRGLLRTLPFKKGKRTLAHHLYLKLLKNVNGDLVTTIGGAKYHLNLADRIQAIFYLTGLYEPETVAACLDLLDLSRTTTYVDVGANVGLIALQVRSQRSNLRCHLFEPDPRNFERLEKNIRASSFSEIKTNQIAVSNTSGETLNFHISPNPMESGWGRLGSTGETRSGERIDVRSVSLDDYFEKNGITEVDVLKIDVEGAEESVLRGAQLALGAKRIKAIICEINGEALEGFGTNPEKLVKVLYDFGYRAVRQAGINSIFLPVES